MKTKTLSILVIAFFLVSFVSAIENPLNETDEEKIMTQQEKKSLPFVIIYILIMLWFFRLLFKLSREEGGE